MSSFFVHPPPSARASLTQAGRAQRERAIEARGHVVANLLDGCAHDTAVDAAALLAPHAVLRVPGRHRLAGRFAGAGAVVGQLREMLGRGTGRQQIVKYEDWLDSEQRVLVIARVRMELPGRVHGWCRLFLFELSGEKITRVDLFEDDQQALDAFVGVAPAR